MNTDTDAPQPAHPRAGLSRRGLLTLAAAAGALTATDLVTRPGAAAAAPAGEPDFGPNVFVYDAGTPAATIQAKLDELYNLQHDNEMGTNRFAVLFKPGAYSVNANLGYYTTVGGLGLSPEDVQITGAVRVVGQPDPTSQAGISALTNFWRSAENLAVTPTDWSNQWAVSQAAPLRRVHIKGILWLEPGNGGYSSGGYIADSKVDGITINGSQQQWLTRDSELGGIWTNGVWNQVFSGCTGPGVPTPDYPSNPYTVLPASPVTREKPFLYVDGDGGYRVFVPALRTHTAGTSWSAGPTPGTSVPISDFFIAKPADGAATINAALDAGKHILFTPGVYHLDVPLMVTHENTILLGLGMPSLTPDRGTAAMRVMNVDGVKVAGLLFDAGPKSSPVLLEVGNGNSRGRAANPISVQDVFFRIGGPWAGKAQTTLVVNADDTILDNVWAWRADHGHGVGWTVNTADTGVIVNGDRVTAYGLFVEHYQQWQTIWNGEDGRTIFYQSEMPYDPPSQAAWTSPTGNGWASYKVAPRVNRHEAWGLGVYCFFNQGVDIRAARGIEVPQTPGVRFHDAVTVFLTGSGGIERTINDAGVPEVGSFGTSYVVEYP
jgi:hypothetical protein